MSQFLSQDTQARTSGPRLSAKRSSRKLALREAGVAERASWLKSLESLPPSVSSSSPGLAPEAGATLKGLEGTPSKASKTWTERNRSKIFAGRMGETAKQLMLANEDEQKRATRLRMLTSTGPHRRRFLKKRKVLKGPVLRLVVRRRPSTPQDGLLVLHCSVEDDGGEGAKTVHAVFSERSLSSQSIQPGTILTVHHPWVHLRDATCTRMETLICSSVVEVGVKA